MLHSRRAHLDDEADGVLGQLGVAPVGDGRLGEGLVGVGRGRLVLGAAHDDAVVGLAHDVQQHVGVLILRPLGAVALRIGVGRDVERIVALRAQDVPLDVARPLRIDLVEHGLAVEERPHLADGLVAHARDDSTEVVEDRVDHALLGVPVLARARQLGRDRVALAVVAGVRDDVARGLLVRHVVDARASVDERLELRVRRHVGDPLAAHPDLAAVAQRLAVVLAGADHATGASAMPAGRCCVMQPMPPPP